MGPGLRARGDSRRSTPRRRPTPTRTASTPIGAPRFDPRTSRRRSPKVYVDEFPFAITEDDLKRGQERYTIYCAVCHGPLGNGQGKIWERGYLKPTSFHTEQVDGDEVEPAEEPAGSRSGISRGYCAVGHRRSRCATCRSGTSSRSSPRGTAAMPSYAAQIPPADRWRIVAYVRVLQLSQHATRRVAAGREEASSTRGREAVSTDPAATPARPRPPTDTDQPDWAALHARRRHRGRRRARRCSLVAGIVNLARRRRRRRRSTPPSRGSLAAYLTGFIFWFSLPLGGDGAPDDRATSRSRRGACCSAGRWRPRPARCRCWSLLFVPLVASSRAASTTRRTGGRTRDDAHAPEAGTATPAPTSSPATSAKQTDRVPASA